MKFPSLKELQETYLDLEITNDDNILEHFSRETPMKSGKEMLNEAIADVLLEVLQRNKYNQSKTAKDLGLSRGTTRNYLERYFPGEFLSKRGE
jgi:transcriptional regulator with AAA-type ATPase domain